MDLLSSNSSTSIISAFHLDIILGLNVNLARIVIDVPSLSLPRAQRYKKRKTAKLIMKEERCRRCLSGHFRRQSSLMNRNVTTVAGQG